MSCDVRQVDIPGLFPPALECAVHKTASRLEPVLLAFSLLFFFFFSFFLRKREAYHGFVTLRHIRASLFSSWGPIEAPAADTEAPIYQFVPKIVRRFNEISHILQVRRKNSLAITQISMGMKKI